MPLLDLSTLEAFILVADLRSFTLAADVLGSTQSAISLKLQRLEKQLGRSLLERTPRSVRVSAEGENFLPLARDMLAANERAFSVSAAPPRRLVLGMSDHVAGPEFPALLKLLAAHDQGLLIEVKIGSSHDILNRYDEGGIDAAIVRKESRRKNGELLFEDKVGWFAAMSWEHNARGPLRLISLTDDCSMRGIAVKSLQAARIEWVDAVIGGGIAATAAAILAGLGVAPMARRIAPTGARDVGPALGLPPLPASRVMLHTRVADHRTKGTLRMLAATFRAELQD